MCLDRSISYERNCLNACVYPPGITGCPLQAYIFMGPIYYQKLKHMVRFQFSIMAILHACESSVPSKVITTIVLIFNHGYFRASWKTLVSSQYLLLSHKTWHILF